MNVKLYSDISDCVHASAIHVAYLYVELTFKQYTWNINNCVLLFIVTISSYSLFNSGKTNSLKWKCEGISDQILTRSPR